MSGLRKLGRYLGLGIAGASLYVSPVNAQEPNDTLTAGDYRFLGSGLEMLQEMQGVKAGKITVLSETRSGSFQTYREKGYIPVTDYKKFRPFLKKADRNPKDYFVTEEELREYYRKFMESKLGGS
ncbi:MAG: hypothetical protein J7K54_03955 [Candidatus Aenigmarchaeota archaeon]|nr:hypothetical protein [Candidatus Aenigmarchaeota archaeon]